MRMNDSPVDQARAWMDALETGRTDALRLTPDFVYSGPFGRIEHVDAASLTRLMSRCRARGAVVADFIEASGRVAVRYDIATQAGLIQACDWIVLAGDRIRRIDSHYAAGPGVAALPSADGRHGEGRGAIW